MAQQLVEQLNPQNRSELLWVPDVDGFHYPDAVERVAHGFNNTDYTALVHQAGEHVYRTRTGIEYGQWRERGDSPTDAIVMYSTYASRIGNNMALRGEFCNRVFRGVGLYDEAGRQLPLVFFGAPADQARYPLDRDQRKQIARGDLGPAATAQLEVIRQKGYGRVAMIGFSQGGSMAAAGARVSHESGLDTTALGAASVPNVKQRGKLALQLAFAAQAPNLRPDLAKGGLTAFQRVHEDEYNEIKYVKAMLSQGRQNWALFSGMTKDRFGSDLEAALERYPQLQTTISVATGERDGVGVAKDTRIVLEDLRHATESQGANAPHFISVAEGNHSWGDRVKLLSTFYAYALSRAAERPEVVQA